MEKKMSVVVVALVSELMRGDEEFGEFVKRLRTKYVELLKAKRITLLVI